MCGRACVWRTNAQSSLSLSRCYYTIHIHTLAARLSLRKGKIDTISSSLSLPHSCLLLYPSLSFFEEEKRTSSSSSSSSGLNNFRAARARARALVGLHKSRGLRDSPPLKKTWMDVGSVSAHAFKGASEGEIRRARRLGQRGAPAYLPRLKRKGERRYIRERERPDKTEGKSGTLFSAAIHDRAPPAEW